MSSPLRNSSTNYDDASPNPEMIGRGRLPSRELNNDWQKDNSIRDVLSQVRSLIMPARSVRDFVAVNPWGGLESRRFEDARRLVRTVCDDELLPELAYYRSAFRDGQISKSDISAAVEEYRQAHSSDAELPTARDVLAALEEDSAVSPSGREPQRVRMRSVAELAEQGDVNQGVLNEVGGFLASYYDDGAASWGGAHRRIPLFQAWRQYAKISRNAEWNGIAGLRGLIPELPHTAEGAVRYLLIRLRVPVELYETVLHHTALRLPGWAAYTRWSDDEAERQGEHGEALTGLTAVLLSHDFALHLNTGLLPDWSSVAVSLRTATPEETPSESWDVRLRSILLRAEEHHHRVELLKLLHAGNSSDKAPNPCPRFRMLFCIDVRSERIRRHIEQAGSEIVTHGCAGFFNMPAQLHNCVTGESAEQLPVLLQPQFTVLQDPSKANSISKQESGWLKGWARGLKEMSRQATSAFAAVETGGLTAAGELTDRTVRTPQGNSPGSQMRGSETEHRGVRNEDLADYAEALLRGSGLADQKSEVVVICGHESHSANNPYAATLDCGACGGHSGAVNARLAADALNNSEIRSLLSQRGLPLSEGTRFVAAVHETTRDRIELLDTKDRSLLTEEEFRQWSAQLKAGLTNVHEERRESQSGVCRSEADFRRLATDWSEVRPEWGLAGNRAIVVGPRSLTQSANLGGTVFLHEYQAKSDPDGEVLAQIMGGPVRVAHGINMQYYAAVCDHPHHGAGTKARHNPVGRIGVQLGNRQDLARGLPWQSVHDGEHFVHRAVRLLSIIAASTDRLDKILSESSALDDLVTNEWMTLIAWTETGPQQRVPNGSWVRLEDSARVVAAD